MVAAVVIACTIPLLSSVMTTAGLRSTLRATPESDEIAVYAGDPGIATPIVQAAYNELLLSSGIIWETSFSQPNFLPPSMIFPFPSA